MTQNISVDPETLQAEMRAKYRAVAKNPHGTFHFHSSRPLAALLGYDSAIADPYCLYADEAVRQLLRRGFNARRLEDGFPEWKRAGLPIAAGTGG